MPSKRIAIVVDTIATLYILLFIYAAVSKIGDTEKFKSQLAQSPILSPFAIVIAYLVPILEILISLLFLSRFKLLSFYASFGLMSIFTVYIIVITQLSEYVPCSCGGILEDFSWNQHLIFNIVFLLLAILAILLHPQHSSRTQTFIKEGKGENREN